MGQVGPVRTLAFTQGKVGTSSGFEPRSDTKLPEGREETCCFLYSYQAQGLAHSRCSLKVCGGFLESEGALGSRPLAHCPYLLMAQRM